MIRPPRRSVTRFFIPLIDVLILLFCIFLLMPIVEEGASGPGEGKLTAAQAHVLRQRLDETQRRVADLVEKRESPETQERIEELERQLREARRSLGKRLMVRTFEFDPEIGKLVYYDPEKVVVQGESQAKQLARRDLNAAQEAKRELYYLLLAPRDLRIHRPNKKELDTIESWFRGITVGVDYPRSGPGTSGGQSQ